MTRRDDIVTPPMMRALGDLPTHLRADGRLTMFAPPLATLHALERAGLAELADVPTGRAWRRTAAGEIAWEMR